MYKPKRIQVSESAKDYLMTKEILDRALKLDPSIPIEYVNSRRPGLPNHLDVAGRYHYMKETLLLTDRTSPFIETFASPGHIVENMGTMIKTLFHCSANCQYCYLQGTAIRQQWQRIYVNLEDLERQIKYEYTIHNLLKTILSAYSLYRDESIVKIPKGFKELADSIRAELLTSDLLTDSKAKKFLKDHIADILCTLEEVVIKDRLGSVKDQIGQLYSANSKIPLAFNISEYSDIAGIEHIAGHLDYFMRLIQNDKKLQVRFFTKFSNFDNLLKYDGHDRVKIIMDVNTQRVIDKFQLGTDKLKDRLDVLKHVQDKGGFQIRLQFEPLITSLNDEKEYTELIEQIFSVIDPLKIHSVALGSVRYKKQLIGIIKNNYPNTELFDSDQYLIEPEHRGDRYRYPIEERIRLYEVVIKKLKSYGITNIQFGAETPELWDLMSYNKEDFFNKSTYQHNS